jgi:hypothetical protein
MIRGYCAIKLAEKIKDGGKRASAHSCAVQMAVHGFGEKDIHLVGVIVVTKGHYARDVRYVASRGRPGQGGVKYHQDDRGPNDGVAKKKAKKGDCRKRRLIGFGGGVCD